MTKPYVVHDADGGERRFPRPEYAALLLDGGSLILVSPSADKFTAYAPGHWTSITTDPPSPTSIPADINRWVRAHKQRPPIDLSTPPNIDLGEQ